MMILVAYPLASVGDDYQLPPIMPGAASAFNNIISTKNKQRKAMILQLQIHQVLKVTKWGELFKRVGKKYIKLRTSQRVLKDQAFFTTCLKGVRGDSKTGLSENNIQKLMKNHSDYWTRKWSNKWKMMKRQFTCLQKIMTRMSKPKKLKWLNSAHHPVATIKSVTSGNVHGQQGWTF